MTQPVIRVFVIMPFTQTPTRNEAQLTSFFKKNIQEPIEHAGDRLANRYSVYRSGQAFNINAEIVKDLYRSDIVIADLSGPDPNPNVMYELGVRLAVSERPVILIREIHHQNKETFDIHGFYAFEYDPFDYGSLEDHLLAKLARFATGEETYDNPILTLIREQRALLEPGLGAVSPARQRELVLSGIQTAIPVVERAMGPHGAGLSVQRSEGEQVLVRRGRDIARALQAESPFEQMGIALLRDHADLVWQEIGDGTKIVTVLAGALIEEGSRLVADGSFVPDLVRGMKDAIQVAIDKVRKLAEPRAGHISAVAATAAKRGSNDQALLTVAETGGAYDIRRVERGEIGSSTTIESTDGVQVHREPVAMEFLASSSQRVLKDCHVLLYDDKIAVMKDLLPICEKVAATKRPLLVIASSVEGEALSTLVLNDMRRNLPCVAVSAPGRSGPARVDLLDDIAVYTGGHVITANRGLQLASAALSDLGIAREVIVGHDTTLIRGGHGEPAAIEARTKNLAAAINTVASLYDRERLLERMAWLQGSVTTITVGGATRQAIEDEVYAIESLLWAVRAAADGVNIGGGSALVHAAKVLDDLKSENAGYTGGVSAVRLALMAVTRCLIVNAGLDPSPLIDELNSLTDPRMGFNAATQRLDNLARAGVLDPTRMLVRAVELGASAATIFLETSSWTVQSSRGPA